MQAGLIKFVVFQFLVYGILAVLGFAAWVMAFTDNLSVLEAMVGNYLSGHLERWTVQFPLWGISILISAALALGAAWFLQKLRKEGAYLGVISFSLGFITNLIFAQNILVHGLIGIIIGWTLLAPLIVIWKHLR